MHGCRRLAEFPEMDLPDGELDLINDLITTYNHHGAPAVFFVFVCVCVSFVF